jgi:predicted ArsR family transcriptional regulator
MAEQMGADAEAATATGRAWGLEAGRRSPSRSCLDSLAAELARLGFEPAADEDVGADGTARIDFLHCPFRELAEAYPELVCNLHRGLCEGVVGETGEGSVVGFSTLYEPDPCHVVVAVT